MLAAMLRIAAVGAGLGVLVTLWAGRLLESILYGVDPVDAWTLGIVLAGVLVLVALAGFLPAVRAARSDPVTCLRAE